MSIVVHSVVKLMISTGILQLIFINLHFYAKNLTVIKKLTCYVYPYHAVISLSHLRKVRFL